MIHSPFVRILGAALLFACTAQAQPPVRFSEDVVTVQVLDENGRELTMAWSGGMNNPQFAMADLNNDGALDLVVMESSTYPATVKTFINVGQRGNPRYVYAPRYARNFPPVLGYLVLEDYNCDGIADLFHRGDGNVALASGVAIFRGYYRDSELCFEYYKNLYYDNDIRFQGKPPINVYVGNVDIPAIADVDGDGDIDIVAYGITNELIYYENVRVENGLHCDSFQVRLADWCWGKIKHGNDIEISYNMGVECEAYNAYLGKPGRDDSAGQKPTHSGDALCLFDADGDGDMDLLSGNVYFDNIAFLENGRKQFGGRDSMVRQDVEWSSSRRVDLPSWPAAYWLDVDDDGRKDILLSPHTPFASENYRNVWLYKNTGIQGDGRYVYQKDTFLIEDMIEVGSAAYPMLYDYNRDGRPDLFIGSDGYYQPDGSFRSALAYYENVSVPDTPRFRRVSSNFLDVFSLGIQGSAPAFGDLNNDGRDELLLGHADGRITVFSNTSGSGLLQPVWGDPRILKDYNGEEIRVGYDSYSGYAMPFIYDLNGDGWNDLIIGTGEGRLQYYENRKESGMIGLELKTDTLGGVSTGQYMDRLAPFIGKVYGDEEPYLFLGTNQGKIFRFGNFTGSVVPGSFTLLDNDFDSIRVGTHTALTIGDIDGDGRYEMIIGNEFGGVSLLQQGEPRVHTRLPSLPETASNSIVLYPNPAGDHLNISLSGAVAQNERVHVQVVNSMGQEVISRVLSHTGQDLRIETVSLAQGLYFCRVYYGGAMYGASFVAGGRRE